jgi:hypothetical protein
MADDEARSLECLLDQLVGKGIIVDPGLLWSGVAHQADSGLIQMISGRSDEQAGG